MVARHTTELVYLVMCTTHPPDQEWPETTVVRVCKHEAAAERFSNKCQERSKESFAEYTVDTRVVDDNDQ